MHIYNVQLNVISVFFRAVMLTEISSIMSW